MLFLLRILKSVGYNSAVVPWLRQNTFLLLADIIFELVKDERTDLKYFVNVLQYYIKNDLLRIGPIFKSHTWISAKYYDDLLDFKDCGMKRVLCAYKDFDDCINVKADNLNEWKKSLYKRSIRESCDEEMKEWLIKQTK